MDWFRYDRDSVMKELRILNVLRSAARYCVKTLFSQTYQIAKTVLEQLLFLSPKGELQLLKGVPRTLTNIYDGIYYYDFPRT